MKLALLGAAGRTGREVLARALADGHQVVALVRKPGSLPEQAQLEVQIGDALDADAVSRLVRGCDAVVSVIGPTRSDPTLRNSRVAAVLVSTARRGPEPFPPPRPCERSPMLR